ncbi:MAG: hypothetical protein LBC92_00445, partial [Rickettsiales bacterium]|nr:hypothetical protein [Rickettsiales bacterium]
MFSLETFRKNPKLLFASKLVEKMNSLSKPFKDEARNLERGKGLSEEGIKQKINENKRIAQRIDGIRDVIEAKIYLCFVKEQLEIKQNELDSLKAKDNPSDSNKRRIFQLQNEQTIFKDQSDRLEEYLGSDIFKDINVDNIDKSGIRRENGIFIKKVFGFVENGEKFADVRGNVEKTISEFSEKNVKIISAADEKNIDDEIKSLDEFLCSDFDKGDSYSDKDYSRCLARLGLNLLKIEKSEAGLSTSDNNQEQISSSFATSMLMDDARFSKRRNGIKFERENWNHKFFAAQPEKQEKHLDNRYSYLRYTDITNYDVIQQKINDGLDDLEIKRLNRLQEIVKYGSENAIEFQRLVVGCGCSTPSELKKRIERLKEEKEKGTLLSPFTMERIIKYAEAHLVKMQAAFNKVLLEEKREHGGATEQSMSTGLDIELDRVICKKFADELSDIEKKGATNPVKRKELQEVKDIIRETVEIEALKEKEFSAIKKLEDLNEGVRLVEDSLSPTELEAELDKLKKIESERLELSNSLHKRKYNLLNKLERINKDNFPDLDLIQRTLNREVAIKRNQFDRAVGTIGRYEYEQLIHKLYEKSKNERGLVEEAINAKTSFEKAIDSEINMLNRIIQEKTKEKELNSDLKNLYKHIEERKSQLKNFELFKKGMILTKCKENTVANENISKYFLLEKIALATNYKLDNADAITNIEEDVFDMKKYDGNSATIDALLNDMGKIMPKEASQDIKNIVKKYSPEDVKEDLVGRQSREDLSMSLDTTSLKNKISLIEKAKSLVSNEYKYDKDTLECIKAFDNYFCNSDNSEYKTEMYCEDLRSNTTLNNTLKENFLKLGGKDKTNVCVVPSIESLSDGREFVFELDSDGNIILDSLIFGASGNGVESSRNNIKNIDKEIEEINNRILTAADDTEKINFIKQLKDKEQQKEEECIRRNVLMLSNGVIKRIQLQTKVLQVFEYYSRYSSSDDNIVSAGLRENIKDLKKSISSLKDYATRMGGLTIAPNELETILTKEDTESIDLSISNKIKSQIIEKLKEERKSIQEPTIDDPLEQPKQELDEKPTSLTQKPESTLEINPNQNQKNQDEKDLDLQRNEGLESKLEEYEKTDFKGKSDIRISFFKEIIEKKEKEKKEIEDKLEEIKKLGKEEQEKNKNEIKSLISKEMHILKEINFLGEALNKFDIEHILLNKINNSRIENVILNMNNMMESDNMLSETTSVYVFKEDSGVNEVEYENNIAFEMGSDGKIVPDSLVVFEEYSELEKKYNDDIEKLNNEINEIDKRIPADNTGKTKEELTGKLTKKEHEYSERNFVVLTTRIIDKIRLQKGTLLEFKSHLEELEKQHEEGDEEKNKKISNLKESIKDLETSIDDLMIYAGKMGGLNMSEYGIDKIYKNQNDTKATELDNLIGVNDFTREHVEFFIKNKMEEKIKNEQAEKEEKPIDDILSSMKGDIWGLGHNIIAIKNGARSFAPIIENGSYKFKTYKIEDNSEIKDSVKGDVEKLEEYCEKKKRQVSLLKLGQDYLLDLLEDKKAKKPEEQLNDTKTVIINYFNEIKDENIIEKRSLEDLEKLMEKDFTMDDVTAFLKKIKYKPIDNDIQDIVKKHIKGKMFEMEKSSPTRQSLKPDADRTETKELKIPSRELDNDDNSIREIDSASEVKVEEEPETTLERVVNQTPEQQQISSELSSTPEQLKQDKYSSISSTIKTAENEEPPKQEPSSQQTLSDDEPSLPNISKQGNSLLNALGVIKGESVEQPEQSEPKSKSSEEQLEPETPKPESLSPNNNNPLPSIFNLPSSQESSFSYAPQK